MKVPFDGYQGRLLICFLFPYNIGHPGFSFLSPEYFSTPIPALNSSILHPCAGSGRTPGTSGPTNCTHGILVAS